MDSTLIFYWIIFKFASNQNSHKILDKFKFQPDQTTDFRVTRPWVPKNTIFDLVWSIAFLVLIGSLLDFQIIWTGIKSWMFWILARSDYWLWCYLPFSAKKPHVQPCPERSLFSFNGNFMKLADKLDRQKILQEFEFPPDWTIEFRVTCPLVAKKKIYSTLSRVLPV